MRVDFYHLTEGSAETALPLIARRTLDIGEKLLIVSRDRGQLERICGELWSRLPGTFLAHGVAGQEHATRQPILLSHEASPINGARFIAIADGEWREADPPFSRTFYLFDAASVNPARECWRQLGQREGVERRYWKQEGGRWREGP